MRLRTLLVCITLGAMLGVGLVTQVARPPQEKHLPASSIPSPVAAVPALTSQREQPPRPHAAPEKEPSPPAVSPAVNPVLATAASRQETPAELPPLLRLSGPEALPGPLPPPSLSPAQDAAVSDQPEARAKTPVSGSVLTLRRPVAQAPQAAETTPPLSVSSAEPQADKASTAEEPFPTQPAPASQANAPQEAPPAPARQPSAPPAPSAGGQIASPGETAPRQVPSPGSAPAAGPPSLVVQPVGEGDQHLEVFVYDRDVREVLALLSRQGGWNILPTQSVQGRVSLALSNVDLETALAAVLRATGYVARREGNIIYVGTPEEFSKYQQSLDVIATRVYRPSYVSANELEQLLTPLLTPQVGKIKASTAAAKGIAPDGNAAGGNDLATGDVLVVQDYESVLRRMDQIVREVDRRPAQVAIEAMILSVELDDENRFGVDFELLRDKAHLRLVVSDPLSNLSNLSLEDGMLNIAYLDSSVAAFVEALETIGDTNVIATPRLLVLNKQRAEILIGAQLGYVNTTVTETSATQSVDFLEVGTQLRLRPYIAHDRMIRLEIHPELSTGNVRIEQGITLPDKEVTSVTTNVLVEDGRTVVIGGLMREELVTNSAQVPFLGSLPIVGVLFQEKSEITKRREILVLVTPRIVDQSRLDHEGDSLAAEFHRRQQVYADKMLPWGKRYLGRKHFRLAQEAWARGDKQRAMRHVNLAIHFDPMNRAAIDLRSDIANDRPHGPHTLPRVLQGAPQPAPVHPRPVPLEPVPSGRPVLRQERKPQEPIQKPR